MVGQGGAQHPGRHARVQHPVAENKKGKMILNLALAEKLGVVFAPSMLRTPRSIRLRSERDNSAARQICAGVYP